MKGVDNLPSTDYEADERLLNVVFHYVEERNMPMYIAKQILMSNLREKSAFNNMVGRLNVMLCNAVINNC